MRQSLKPTQAAALTTTAATEPAAVLAAVPGAQRTAHTFTRNSMTKLFIEGVMCAKGCGNCLVGFPTQCQAPVWRNSPENMSQKCL